MRQRPSRIKALAPVSATRARQRPAGGLEGGARSILLLLALFLGGLGPARGQDAYVTSAADHKLTVIDTTRNAVVSTISLDAYNPGQIAVSPDGRTAYIEELYHLRENIMRVLDLATGVVTASVTVDPTHGVGGSLIVSPDSKTIYTSEGDEIDAVDAATDRVTVRKIEGLDARLLALSPDGKRLYAAGMEKVTVLDSVADAILSVIPVAGSRASAIVASPDGQKVYVVDDLANTVSVIDTARNTVATTISVGKGPSAAAISPDGKTLYVATAGYNVSDIEIDESHPHSDIEAVDTVTGAIAHIPCPGDVPRGIAVTPDGREAYAVNMNTGTVSVVDTAKNAIIARLSVGREPRTRDNFIGPPPPRAKD